MNLSNVRVTWRQFLRIRNSCKYKFLIIEGISRYGGGRILFIPTLLGGGGNKPGPDALALAEAFKDGWHSRQHVALEWTSPTPCSLGIRHCLDVCSLCSSSRVSSLHPFVDESRCTHSRRYRERGKTLRSAFSGLLFVVQSSGTRNETLLWCLSRFVSKRGEPELPQRDYGLQGCERENAPNVKFVQM